MDLISNSNILLIDDSKLNRTIVKNTLNEIGANITECENGAEGIEKLEKETFQLIIVDTIMPVMDGLTFLKKIRKRNEKLKEFIPVVLMTGNEEVESKIQGLNLGADDFLLKPINQKELIARSLSLLRLKQTHDLLYLKNEQTKNELKTAKKVQQFIIPEDFSFIEDININGMYKPMEEIGGDFFDAYNLGNGKIGILIADVTGHGIPAALIVTMSKMIFSIYAHQYKSTAKLLQKVNSEIKKMLLEEQYITAFYAIYDLNSKTLRFTNAGHCKPLLYRKNLNKIRTLDTNGFFLGIMDKVDYEERAIKIDEEDILFMYTDGVTELKNLKRDEFGEKNLAKFIMKNSELSGKEFCNNLFDTLNEFAHESNDDIAFLNIKFKNG